MNMQKFVEKYGWKGLSMMVEQLISRAPAFDGDGDLAEVLGACCSDLESALKDTLEIKD